MTGNGAQFMSRDFLKFSRDWDFEHLTSNPHQGNGKAGSAVKEANKILRKCIASGSDAFLALLDHCNTPPASVQVSPAQCLFNRSTRSLLPMMANLLAPQAVSDNELCRAKLEQRKQRQAQYYNRSAIDLDPLRRGDVVRLKPFQLSRREWQKGIVRSRLDERLYEVETPSPCGSSQPCSPTKDKWAATTIIRPDPCWGVCPHLSTVQWVPEEVDPPAPIQESAPLSRPDLDPTPAESPPKPVLRRSECQRRLPKRFSDFILTKPWTVLKLLTRCRAQVFKSLVHAWFVLSINQLVCWFVISFFFFSFLFMKGRVL